MDDSKKSSDSQSSSPPAAKPEPRPAKTDEFGLSEPGGSRSM